MLAEQSTALDLRFSVRELMIVAYRDYWDCVDGVHPRRHPWQCEVATTKATRLGHVIARREPIAPKVRRLLEAERKTSSPSTCSARRALDQAPLHHASPSA